MLGLQTLTCPSQVCQGAGQSSGRRRGTGSASVSPTGLSVVDNFLLSAIIAHRLALGHSIDFNLKL